MNPEKPKDFLGQEDDDLEAAEEKEEGLKLSFRGFFLTSLIFLVALAVRLYSLYHFTDPQNAGVEGWYSDVYHHWQIAYLSKTVGFHEGFLRLWDLKGLEYFWGLAHPLVGAFLIAVTKTTSIVVFRIFSAAMGSLALAFLFLIARRHWGIKVGLAVVLLGMLNPVGIFSDASGMVEPMGIAALLSGIYFFPSLPILSGLLLAFAGMARAEYWLLGGLAVLGMLLVKTLPNKKPLLLLGYGIPILAYMKYLLDYTGNPIYPIWWNFMGNAVGKWQLDILPTPEQLFIQKVYWIVAAISLFGLIYSFWKRPKYTPLLIFGFGNWFLWSVVIGMTKYLLSYLPRFWVDRIMVWPYLFVGVLIGVLLIHTIPKFAKGAIKLFLEGVGFILVLVVLFLSQLAWLPIKRYYQPTKRNWERLRGMAEEIGNYDPKEGRVLIPEYWPPLTYMLVYFEGLEGPRIIGQMFDPYFYMERDPYENWEENREIVLDWFKKENIKMIVFVSEAERYVELVERESDYFKELSYKPEWGLHIVDVDLESMGNR